MKGVGQLLLSGSAVLLFSVGGHAASPRFADFCAGAFKDKGKCPPAICRLECRRGETVPPEEDCEKICVPRECAEIPAGRCPKKYCALMTDCSDQQICRDQMTGEGAECGDVAYAGQDVDCCPGLVRRCGYEFIDGTCDMEGKNSVYQLPICVPCGNGICDNFEDRCNCPEDCGAVPQHGGSMRDMPFPYVKSPQGEK